MKHFRILRPLMGACLLLVCATAFAVPAKRVTKTVTMTDGTQVVVTFQGDENLHFYKTADGRIVEPTADGTFAYVSAEKMKARRAKAAQRRESMNKARRVKHKVGNAGNYIGSKKGLVILMQFQDVKMQSSTATTFPRMANEVGYNGNGHYGSVHDYFKAQSYNQFDLTFDVVGPYTTAQNMAYYGAPSGDDIDSYPATMVIEAINAADPYVNFADYDWDGDGEVDQVYVIYAGYGEASGASENTIWPHEWNLYSANYYGDGSGPQCKDGVNIDTYACSNELDGTSGTKLDGIGTMCHEFSHCLGLPDFYDTGKDGNFGMDSWSIMDYGCYNSDGCIPCGYTAYERMFAGWLTPSVLDDPATITDMPDINDQTEGGAPKAYIIYNKANSNEFYTLQNIQQTGWNQGAYGHGLLVGHIDYDSNVWEYNEVNTTDGWSGNNHQRGTIIHADNEDGGNSTSLAGDPFPGTKKKTSLTNTTTPAATLYNNNSDGKKFLNGPLTEITESTSGLISFLFDGGEQAPSPELAWSKTYLSVDSDEGGTPSYPTLTNTHGVSVTYSSSNTAVATISTSGVVTLTGTSGTTTISAIFAGNDDYQAQTVTYTLVVYSSSAGDEPAGTLWEEDFGTKYETNKTTYQYDLTNTTFQTQNSTNTNILAGGESPELLIKANKTFSAVIPMNGHYGDMTLTFKSNRDVVTTTASGATLGDATITGSKPYVYTIPVSVSAGTESVTLYFKAGSDNARFDDARLYQGEEPTPTLVSPELAWSAAASSARVGASDNVYPTLSNPHNVSVTYTSSNTSAATIATNGTITPVAAGATTISAIFAGNSTYEAQTVTYQLTVLEAESGDDDEVVELWSEDFHTYSANNVPTGGTYSYACTGSGTKIYSETTAGGTSPELLINGKNNGTFSATIPMNGHSGELTLTFLSNKNITVNASGATLTQKTTTSPYTYTVNVPTGTTTVTFTFSNDGANCRVDNFLLTAPSSVDPQPQSAGLAWSTTAYTATIDGENSFPTLTNPHSVSVSYTSSNTAAATINATTGAITLVAPGTTTISAIFDGNDDYQAQTVTYNLAVSIANDITNPYTIAEAYDLIDADYDLDTWVYVKGVISNITEVDVTGTYGNATYSISDNSTTDELLIYRGYGLNNVKFNAGAEIIQIGDEVIVYGKLLYYQQKDLYEMDANNYIVSHTHPTPPTPPANTLDLTDGDTYSATSAHTYDEVTYTRTFGNTSWQALYLPFSLSYDDWKDELEIAEIYNIIQYDDDNNGSFDRTYLVILHKTSGQTLPNRPYLVRAKTAGTFTRTLNNVTLQPAESKSIDCSSTFYTYTFTGIYAQRDASVMIANGDYALGGGELHQADTDANLKPQRWFMHITPREGAPTLAPRAIGIIEHGEETTGIADQLSTVNTQLSTAYDLQGRKLSPSKGERREGLYILNGKKVIR